MSFLGWLFALVGCGKPCWISSALGRFVPSPASVMWFSGRTLRTRNSVRKQGLFPGREHQHCPLGSLAPCLSQLLERDFGDAPALLDGVRGLGMTSTLLPHLHWEKGVNITTRFFLLSLTPRTCSPGPGWSYPDFGTSKH